MAVTAECIVNDSALRVTVVTGHLLDVCKADVLEEFNNDGSTSRVIPGGEDALLCK